MRRLKQILSHAGLLLLFCSTSFTARAQGSITDIDGNSYRTAQIGDQIWMVENLRTTKLNDGTVIEELTDKKEWVRTTMPAYSWYEDVASNKTVYGGLYNWQAVETEKLCPEGWEVPTDDDWTVLLGKLEESPLKKLEELGFPVVAGGYRYGYYWGSGTYQELEMNGYWWSSTPCTDTHIWSRTLSVDKGKVYRSYFEKNNGFSVRCIKCLEK